MKKIASLTVFLICIGITRNQAQSLELTQWKSFFAAPINDTATIIFSKDTSKINNSKGLEIVRSIFRISHDTVTIKDIGGEIACSDEIGVYTYTMSKTTLKLILVSDACEGRANSLGNRVWTRTKQ